MWPGGGAGSLLRGDSVGGLRGVDLSQAGCFHAPGERRERLCPRHPAGVVHCGRGGLMHPTVVSNFSGAAQLRNLELRGS